MQGKKKTSQLTSPAMRPRIAGGFTLVASITVPATFQGTTFLIVIWLLLGLAGLLLILTSEPVKRRLVDGLRRELRVPDASPTTEAVTAADPNANPAALRQLALSEIAEELEAAEGVLTGPNMARFFVDHELATHKWERYGPVLAVNDPVLHKACRTAFRAIDALNNRGITRGDCTPFAVDRPPTSRLPFPSRRKGP